MYAIIMAGGRGARFWPKSRERLPKHLLDITSEKTIIQETVDRIESIFPAENIFIVTGQSHADELIRQLPKIPIENIIIEPEGKNTAPCIGLASLYIKIKDPTAVMAIMPADHLIDDAKELCGCIAAACEMASRGEHILTIGITPTQPETGYGYIEQGKLITTVQGKDIFGVKSIREKPALKQAKSFLKKGEFYWNSGMFICRSDVILRSFKKLLPEIYDGLMEIERALGTSCEQEVLSCVYGKMTAISMDYGIMEKADNVLLLKGDFRWSDVGSWDAVWEISKKDGNGNAVNSEDLFLGINTGNSLIHTSGKLIAIVGLDNLIVVETKDALLICRRGSSQDVKLLVEQLEKRKMKDYL